MRAIRNSFIALIALACVIVLAISIYPGVLGDLLLLSFLLAFLVVPVIGLAAILVLFVLGLKGQLKVIRIPWKQAVVVLALLVCACGLMILNVPRRIAFATSRSSFEKFVPQATPSEYGGTVLNRCLGVYHVDQYAADPRGGVYFRVFSGADGIGPDVMSHGFAHKPNTKGTPFGAASYGVYHLGNDWYWFCASDDWH